MNAQPLQDIAQMPTPVVPESDRRENISPALNSASLLRGQKTVTIDHNGAIYRLQATRQGKLILTK